MQLPHISYNAVKGEDIANFYRREGKNPADSSEFLRFQESLYNVSVMRGFGKNLKWKERNLEILKDGRIFIPDLNRSGDNKTSKERFKPSRKYTLA